jgi:hypothetical protein
MQLQARATRLLRKKKAFGGKIVEKRQKRNRRKTVTKVPGGATRLLITE